ncbi:MAG: C40 family peptidase [Candidatus Caenarcaniphilales bacterium]|nr:C40 family peptidase [Candidatus Caenarcaniphilales bacterium]
MSNASQAEPKLKCYNVAECQAVFEQTAKNFLGSSYSYGSTGKRGFDCSGLVVTVMGKLMDQVTLPRSSQDMYRSLNQAVSLETAKRGDLLFFNTGHGVSHVGLYWGKDGSGRHVMFHSSSSKGVELRPLNGDKYWMSRLVGVKRFAPLSDALFLSGMPAKADDQKSPEAKTSSKDISNERDKVKTVAKTQQAEDKNKKEVNNKTNKTSLKDKIKPQKLSFKPMKRSLGELQSSYEYDDNYYSDYDEYPYEKRLKNLQRVTYIQEEGVDQSVIAYDDYEYSSNYEENNLHYETEQGYYADEEGSGEYYDEYY